MDGWTDTRLDGWTGGWVEGRANTGRIHPGRRRSRLWDGGLVPEELGTLEGMASGSKSINMHHLKRNHVEIKQINQKIIFYGYGRYGRLQIKRDATMGTLDDP